MSKLRKAARGQDCMIRVPGVCNGNPETTVLAHLGGGGMGRKHHDLLGAWACSSCHDYVDGRTKAGDDPRMVRLAHLDGMVRTIDKLADMGLI
jgi:hypothetical protein